MKDYLIGAFVAAKALPGMFITAGLLIESVGVSSKTILPIMLFSAISFATGFAYFAAKDFEVDKS